jgi:hypothetical protein
MHALPLSPASPLAPLAPAAEVAPRCAVCGGASVRTDEVAERVVVRLAHCTRCDHRWTWTLTPAADAPAPARPVRRVRRPGVRPAA